jgi:hypothetical protein
LKNSKQIAFETFRFQILPLKQDSFQFELFDQNFNSVEKLVKNKNKILKQILSSKSISFEHSKSKISIRFEIESKNNFLFRINVRRIIRRNTEDFREERIEDYPYLYIAINNSSTKQIIAIQENVKAFAKTEIVSHLLEKNLNRYLKRYNLAIYIEPIYSKEEFWNIAKLYKHRVTNIRFELVRPNMSNISGKIDEQLKQLEKTTDAHRLNLELSSGSESNLKLIRNNRQLAGLVEYAAQGGGNSSFKIKGLKKRIKTSRNPKEIYIDELEIKNLTSEALLDVFKLLLQ